MSAASLATSVPRMPMAMPTSASFSAGASFTPSPVMAVMYPPKCRYARTMVRLCMGDTRAKTRVSVTQCCQKRPSSQASSEVENGVKSSSGGMCSSIMAPVTTRHLCASSSCSGRITPMRRAMASAVLGWSPVTMTVFAPAIRMRCKASTTPALGGSSRATRPQKVKPSMGKFASLALLPWNLKSWGLSVIHCSAKHSTRLPSCMRLVNAATTPGAS
mmetsp:Transcript_5219/g.14766  ORF Transcript_5219/g.14766 Transcript_5219/m.14766 type:complete len:217 (-) Transcript_5219:1954-2604(-)